MATQKLNGLGYQNILIGDVFINYMTSLLHQRDNAVQIKVRWIKIVVSALVPVLGLRIPIVSLNYSVIS